MVDIKFRKAIFYLGAILVLIIFIFSSCNKNKQILKLLNSDKKEDIIRGAYLAGETGDKQFVPLLLKNADDIRTSTNIRFKGFTVYEEKMVALRKIFKQEPPVKIVGNPDSVVIKFYLELVEKEINK